LAVVLKPYFPGNAMHGHAAKLFSNAYATVIVADDHHVLTRQPFGTLQSCHA
jgi:hypothetical protein